MAQSWKSIQSLSAQIQHSASGPPDHCPDEGRPCGGQGLRDPDLVRDLLAALEAPGSQINATTMTPDERQAFIETHTVLRKPA